MNPGLVTADSELELAERGWQHRGIVWLPSKMVLADKTIPQNWQVTSDSLSAWLADKIGAEQLILVKSRPLIGYQKEASAALKHLVKDEVIDSQFDIFSAEKHFQAWALNKADYTIFENGFSLQSLLKKGLLINGTLN
jgi:aspartokinase-like uncharacterized kinase